MRVDYNTALENASHEGLVRMAYYDSVGVLTWSIGVTRSSGHRVKRYVDKPQTLEHCLKIYVWLLETKYAPAVRKAFAGYDLSREEFAAALEFHYNTGKIATASWVKLVKAGQMVAARRSLLSWNKVTRKGKKVVSKGLTARRKKTAALFFDRKWSNDGTINEITRLTKTRRPIWKSIKKINIERELRAALGTSVTVASPTPPRPQQPDDPGVSDPKPTGSWIAELIKAILRAFKGSKP